MAEIQQICYTRTFNLGNYENEVIEVTVSVDEGEDAAKVLAGARKWVLERFLDGHPGVRVVS